MIHYRCNYCNVVFAEPTVAPYRETVGEFTRQYDEEHCPICGCDSFEEVEECPDCGEMMTAGSILCKKCAKQYMRRVNDCFAYFTAAGEAWFDAQMDGDFIENRRNWK